MRTARDFWRFCFYTDHKNACCSVCSVWFGNWWQPRIVAGKSHWIVRVRCLLKERNWCTVHGKNIWLVQLINS